MHKADIADFDDPLVEVLESRGAIIIGKTNIPEFSAGKTNGSCKCLVAVVMLSQRYISAFCMAQDWSVHARRG